MKKYDLVIVRDDAIGDFFIWIDTLKAYEEKYKGKKVLLICDTNISEVAMGSDFFTEVISYTKKDVMKSPSKFFLLLKNTKKIEAKEVLYPIWTHHLIGCLIVMSIKSKRKIGMTCKFVDKGYSVRTIFKKFFDKHIIESIDISDDLNEIKAIEYFTQRVTVRTYKYGYNKLEPKGEIKGLDDKYVLVSLSSSVDYKIWNMSRFAMLINMIPRSYVVVLSGVGDGDMKRASEIKKLVDNSVRLIDMVNKTSVKEMVLLISKAVFVIGNDSAAVHIAAATHVPSVCLLHGAQFGRFLPYPTDLPFPYFCPRPVYFKMDCYGCNFHCTLIKNGSYECLDKVTVEMAGRELKKLINEIECHE